MKNQDEHLEALTQIRSLMERSSRFISLSGLSGVAAGLIALCGATLVYIYLGIKPFSNYHIYYMDVLRNGKWGLDYRTFFLADALLVLVLALAAGVYFTGRKARQKGQKIWDPLTRRMLLNLAIPLAIGGVFCLALSRAGMILFVAPATLVFYGLALINGAKYTLDDIRNLGICEAVLGLSGMFFPGFGLELWAIGFGFLHIVYGALMWRKYDRNSTV
jgi:hypothetical protein